MKVAALYDIHGNLPALEAVLEELEQAHFDLIVIGGDIGPGPMPKQTLQRLLNLGDRARIVAHIVKTVKSAQIRATLLLFNHTVFFKMDGVHAL